MHISYAKHRNKHIHDPYTNHAKSLTTFMQNAYTIIQQSYTHLQHDAPIMHKSYTSHTQINITHTQSYEK